MAAKLGFEAACLGLLALASGTLLSTAPNKFLGTEGSALGGDAINALLKSEPEEVEPKELEEMESAITTLVTNGDDPASKVAVKHMNDFIEKTLIPNREKAQAADQKWLDSQLEALKNCHLDKKMPEDTQKIAMDHKIKYDDCVSECTDVVKRGECLAVLENKKLVRDGMCVDVDDVEKTCQSSDGENSCCEAHNAVAKQHEECDCKPEIECAKPKTDWEYAEKEHKRIEGQVCTGYTTCYEDQSKVYANAEKSVKANEKLRSWETLYRIQCLVGAFKDGKVSDSKATECKEKDYDVKGIEYPETLPTKQECNEA